MELTLIPLKPKVTFHWCIDFIEKSCGVLPFTIAVNYKQSDFHSSAKTPPFESDQNCNVLEIS